MSPALIIFIVLSAAAMVYVARLRRQRLTQRMGQQDLVCGGCGYSVVGLERMICPECGGDLRTVGIIPPGYRCRSSVPGSIVLLLITVLVAGFPVSFRVEEMAPWPMNFYSSAASFSPKSKAFLAVNLVAVGRAWNGGRLTFPVTATLSLNARSRSTMTVDVEADVVRWTDQSGEKVERKGVNLEHVLQWFASAGIDVSDREVIEEARDIAISAQIVARQPPVYSRDRSSTWLGGSMGSALSGRITRRVSSMPPVWTSKARFWYLGIITLAGAVYVVRIGWLRQER